jgi:hypothetical protein
LAIPAALGLSRAVAAADFSIGTASIAAPTGWREIKKTDQTLILESGDGRQRATLSVMRLGADASFDEFKKLCDLRMQAERKELSDGFVEPDAPFEGAAGFGMFFSGSDKKTGRVFSGYLSLEKRDLITLYVEGVDVAPRDHLESFKGLTTGLKRK